jgi:hypothetical protein
MRGKELLIQATGTLSGHPQRVLLELLKIDSSVINGVKLQLTLRGSNWWADEDYTLPPIKQGNSSAAEDMAQGLYKKDRLPPDSLNELLRYIDDARRATGD